MNDQEAIDTVSSALMQVVAEADVRALSPDEPFREALDMDSLDFLSFVEKLAETTQVRIDEDDYGRLTTMSSCARFLQAAPVR